MAKVHDKRVLSKQLEDLKKSMDELSALFNRKMSKFEEDMKKAIASGQEDAPTQSSELQDTMPEVHEAFRNSGQKAGLEIWRIENFEPVPVPQQQFGNFYSGDSYIVLKTIGTTNKFSYDIHFWLGAGTSGDEAGTAAILTVNLDEGQFNGAAIQHREVQGYESKEFLEYFKPAIRYLEGGHASGFSHVTTNAGAEKRLFQIKGKRNVRVRQVEASITSMNKGDCFVLDVDHVVYLYVGEKAGPMEKIKANSVAHHIRDQDHNGRASVEVIDVYSNEGDVDKFFEVLGSGDKDSVPTANEGGDDEVGDDEDFEKSSTVVLSEVSDSTGNMKISKLPEPLAQEQLKEEECYILDTGRSGIYVWVGRKSNDKERREAFNTAQKYLKVNSLPEWVHVTKVPDGLEPTTFKEYFNTWQ